jgi:hypothetical protein
VESQLSEETAFRYWFRLSEMSKNALARTVTERAAARGHIQVRPDGSRVRRWLDHGERPRDPVPDLIAEILSERTGYRLSAADLGLAPAPGGDEARYRGPAEILTDIQRTASATLAHGPNRPVPTEYSDTPQGSEPRHLLNALESWSWSSPRPLPAAAPKGRLGRADAERIAAHARAAVGLLTTAAGQRAEHRVRSRAFDAIALARAQLFTALDSARVRRRYRDLAREAAAHPDIPHARQIHELLTTGRP